MASSSKKKTTMAKIARENAVRERRMRKAARKNARKQEAADLRDGNGQTDIVADDDDIVADDDSTEVVAPETPVRVD